MENASKALIIAGAILLAILLISLGIMVYNQAKGTINDADLSAEEVQTFNTKFTSYGGTQSGTKINSLMDAVAANNGSSSHKVLVFDGTSYYGPSGAKVKNSTGTEYTVDKAGTYPQYDRTASNTVKFEYDESGYVCLVKIN